MSTVLTLFSIVGKPQSRLRPIDIMQTAKYTNMGLHSLLSLLATGHANSTDLDSGRYSTKSLASEPFDPCTIFDYQGGTVRETWVHASIK